MSATARDDRMKPPKGNPITLPVGYLVAVAATAFTALLRWLLPWALSPAPYLGFYPAVVISAALGGVGPGLFSTFASLFLVNFVFGSFDIHDSGSMMRQFIWVVASIGVSLLAGMQRGARLSELRQRERLTSLNAELSGSMERLGLALDAANAGSWEWDVTSDSNIWSEEVWKLYGLEPHSVEPSFEAWLSTVHTEDREALSQEVTATAKELGNLNLEWRVVRQDGAIHWLMAVGRPSFEADGTYVRYLGIVIDITERKEAEIALRKTKDRLGALITASSEVIYDMSPDWSEMRQLIGQGFIPDTDAPDREWLGRYIPPGDQPLVCAAIDEAIRTKSIFQLEHRVVLVDGTVGWTVSRAVPLLDAEGEIVEWFGTARDVTERKQAMERLAERSAQLEELNASMRQSRSAALSMMEDAVLAQRRAEELGREQARTAARLNLLAQVAGNLLASASPQEIVEELCTKVMEFLDCHVFFNFLVDKQTDCLRLNACAGIPDEERDRIEWLDYGVAVCGCAARDACRIVTEDIPNTPDPRTDLVKSYGVQAYACHPLIAHGELLGTLSFGTRNRAHFSTEDLAMMKAVTDQVAIAMERKQGESDLLKAKELADSATRAKSQFLANMSHELRTPMTGVIGMLDLVLMEELTAEQQEYVVTAHRAAHSLVRILNDILDMTKIEAGKLVIEERPFSLRTCVKDTFDILLPAARGKGLQLETRVADDLPDDLSGDHTRISQVLTNLAGNAVKFTERGKVTLEISGGEGSAAGRRLVVFRVTDTGIGIPEEKRNLLFREFSQLDESHSRRHGGTGLGLAISKEIVERMGGSITLASEPGKGSSFTFSIPLAEAAGKPAAAAPVATPADSLASEAAEPVRLLLAEDDPIISKTLLRMLAIYKYEVDLAENGRQAVDRWESAEYDLILMDVQMPGLNGFEATGLIRQKEAERGGRIPIIAMTAHALKEDHERCLAAGMDAHIAKPIDFKATLQMIKEMVRGRA
ncbi:ATP-binding protein [Geomonas sp. Red32]|uniref:ATP-binding protein n=1 Tax=Geomonas sp. Red32 TaxID=2912856 RepID=UPI00202CB4A3|nr:ATP-binding protein [Geomonas sp. Red32]MCM0080717.1 ATP-binding protein [Geomonas sp. Red32]